MIQRGQGIRQRILMVLAWIAIAIIAYFAAAYLLALASAIFRLHAYFSSTVGALVAHVLLLGLMLAIMTVGNYLLSRRMLSLRDGGIARPVRWRDIGLGLAGVVLYGILSAIVLSIAQTVPGFNGNQAQNLGVTTLFGTERLLGFVVLAVVTPFFEELLFRGILFTKIRATGAAFWPSAIIVSALFATAHGQWNVGLDVFCLSLVACYLRESTDSIWAGVIIHMIKNMVAFYFLFVVMHGLGG